MPCPSPYACALIVHVGCSCCCCGGGGWCAALPKKVEARKRVLLALPAPQVLVLHINRTAWEASGVHKVQTHVTFPLELDTLQPYCASDASACAYRLVSVVSHHGRHMSGGHFTAYGMPACARIGIAGCLVFAGRSAQLNARRASVARGRLVCRPQRGGRPGGVVALQRRPSHQGEPGRSRPRASLHFDVRQGAVVGRPTSRNEGPQDARGASDPLLAPLSFSLLRSACAFVSQAQ